MSETMTLVLNHRQIQQKITRMAFEIYERNVAEEGVIFAGISGMGYILAGLLAEKLREISPLNVKVVEILLEKDAVVQGKVSLSDEISFDDKCLILVDDVLNTGKTLAYSLKPFLESPIKKIEIAVLVNRSHKLFPVTPDYAGLELSTTLSEHITVDLSSDQFSVHLH
ncbi:phosphoribosyltransferase family protein [Rhodonellum sp.]|uniref:phosphoribosyltransferase family protein n=1 Tax=Rhodonellum sp. TaxID=2231180 RepID=UPI0027217282|nr:phosphoribosyltransferase family protein [Rhodonellum sp.]MDO9552078.1 phosphoribosyltransferase family protein [Rhodonellum sp.]